MFFGPKISTVFTSRWKALFWCASVLVTVWSVIPSGDDKDAGGTDAAASAVAQVLGAPQPTATASRSPWAPDPK